MKLFLIIFLLPICLNAQKSIDPDGHIKHYYISAIISAGTGEIIYKKTKLNGISSLIGTGIGITVNMTKEFVIDGIMKYGQKTIGDIIVGNMGAICGGFLHRISLDLREKKKQRELYKLELSKDIF